MNRILNDYGEWVVADGSPGSVNRAMCEHPRLINDLAYTYHRSLDFVIHDDLKRQHNISSLSERESIIIAIRQHH